MGSHQGGGLNFCIRGTPLPTEVVSNCYSRLLRHAQRVVGQILTPYPKEERVLDSIVDDNKQTDRYLAFGVQSTPKGHIRAKLNVLLPQVKF